MRARDAALFRVRLCAQGLRAQAELAALTRGRGDADALHAHLGRARKLLTAARRAATEAATVTPNANGWRALAEAEYCRARGPARPDTWFEAAATWERLERPPIAAYCRWRQAEALVAAGGDGTGPLREAHAVAARSERARRYESWSCSPAAPSSSSFKVIGVEDDMHFGAELARALITAGWRLQRRRNHRLQRKSDLVGDHGLQAIAPGPAQAVVLSASARATEREGVSTQTSRARAYRHVSCSGTASGAECCVRSMQAGPVDKLLDVTVERAMLQQLEVEVERTPEDRV